jgi:CRISPR-associated protein Csd1
MFYMAGVAGNGGRMLIRYWVTETLSAVKGNLKGWFEDLQVEDVFTGKLAESPKLWQLLYAIEREGEPPADRVVALIRRAIAGEPLGGRILGAALARLRVAKSNRLDAVRAGLIRLCLNDGIRLRGEGGKLMTAALDTGQKHEAYLCGRLLAVYESLQYTASGDVNQTVADRYFTLASTYPGQAFPKMEDLSNKHLRKLRRDNYGAMVRISQEIDQLHLEIEEASGFKFPKALDLDCQGRFALGYHHQRAHQMAQAQAGKAAKAFKENSEGKSSEDKD